jgi:hypothetical protein
MATGLLINGGGVMRSHDPLQACDAGNPMPIAEQLPSLRTQRMPEATRGPSFLDYIWVIPL